MEVYSTIFVNSAALDTSGMGSNVLILTNALKTQTPVIPMLLVQIPMAVIPVFVMMDTSGVVIAVLLIQLQLLNQL